MNIDSIRKLSLIRLCCVFHLLVLHLEYVAGSSQLLSIVLVLTGSMNGLKKP